MGLTVVIWKENLSKMIDGMVVGVKEQKSMYNADVQQAQKKVIDTIKTEKQRRYYVELARFKDEIADPTQMWLLEITLESGSSNWLTTPPIKEHGFYLEKKAFWDTFYLRYNYETSHIIVYVATFLVLSILSRVQKMETLALDKLSYEILQLNYLTSVMQM